MSTNKPFTRKVQDLGNGQPGVSIPKDLAKMEGVERGDEIPMRYDEDEGELSFVLD